MRKPQFLNICLLGKGGGFLHRHVLVALCLLIHAFLAVHALEDGKIGVRGVCGNALDGAGVGGIDQLQTLAGAAKHHIRRVDFAVLLALDALLQRIPEFERNTMLLGAQGVEASLTVQLDGIAVAENIVIDTKGGDGKAVDHDRLLRPVDFPTARLKGQLRRNGADGSDNAVDALGTDDGDRLGAIRISHRQEQSRKACDVIGMKMRDQYRVNGLDRAAMLMQGDLRSLAAVDQQTVSVVAHKKGGQITLRQRHHTTGSE